MVNPTSLCTADTDKYGKCYKKCVLTFFSFLPFLCYVLFIQWMSVKLVQYILHKLLLIIGYLLHTAFGSRATSSFSACCSAFVSMIVGVRTSFSETSIPSKRPVFPTLRNPISPTLCLIFRASFTVLVRTRNTHPGCLRIV